MSDISDRLYAAISNKDYSYGDLSKLTGIPKSAIQRYATGETEKIPIDRLEALAAALGVSSAYLMGWEEPELSTSPEDFALQKQHEEINALFDSLPPELRTLALNHVKDIARLAKSQGARGESD